MKKEYITFLKEVESLNNKYASIYFNVELESLVMPFWSWDEIQAGLELRQEWEVLCTWTSVKDFMSCLSEKEIVYDDETMAGGVHHFGDSKGHVVKH